jgi:hypothetical protein
MHLEACKDAGNVEQEAERRKRLGYYLRALRPSMS